MASSSLGGSAESDESITLRIFCRRRAGTGHELGREGLSAIHRAPIWHDLATVR